MAGLQSNIQLCMMQQYLLQLSNSSVHQCSNHRYNSPLRDSACSVLCFSTLREEQSSGSSSEHSAAPIKVRGTTEATVASQLYSVPLMNGCHAFFRCGRCLKIGFWCVISHCVIFDVFSVIFWSMFLFFRGSRSVPMFLTFDHFTTHFKVEQCDS